MWKKLIHCIVQRYFETLETTGILFKREIKLMSTCLVKTSVSDVDSTLKLKSKITVANSD